METCNKKCIICGKVLPTTFFYNRTSSNNTRNECKKCTDAKVKKWHKKHPEKYMEYSRRYWAKHPERKKAHTILNHAIRDEKILKGTHCDLCGSTTRLEAHHDDYSKPLAVRWLCIICHNKQPNDKHGNMRKKV